MEFVGDVSNQSKELRLFLLADRQGKDRLGIYIRPEKTRHQPLGTKFLHEKAVGSSADGRSSKFVDIGSEKNIIHAGDDDFAPARECHFHFVPDFSSPSVFRR